MTFFFASCVALAMALAAWIAQKALGKAYLRYQAVFHSQAKAGLGEFFLFLDPAQLWSLNALACCGLTLAAYLSTGSLAVCALAGGFALVTPRYLIVRLRKRRLARFDQQLPDLLLALAGALRAGQGVQSALRHIVGQAPAPLSQEFGLMLREQRMGVAFDEALSGLYRRVPTEGAGLVVSSLKIAVQSGGNLAETLERIASTLRARLHLLGRIHALTSQGRMQAWVMALLPFLLALVLDWLDPASMSMLWHSRAGWAVLGIVVLLESAGVVFIRRIVDIDV